MKVAAVFCFLWLESNRCFLWQLLILAGQKIGYRHIRKTICFYRIPIVKAHSKDKKTSYYYYCKNTVTPTGHEYNFRLNIEQTEINKFVAKIVSAMVNDPRFVEAIQAKIGTAVDTEDMEKRIAVLQGQLKQTFGTKSRLERQMDTLDINDANVAALGEMWQGVGKGYQDVLMVTLGTGVGGGCVLNGKIVSGIHGAGGEIGHMPVMDKEPIACNCGNHGCLEQYVSATGIVNQAKKVLDLDDRASSLRNYSSLEAKNIYDEAKNGDVIANETVDSTCKILAKALAQVCSMIDPEIIVIGGGISKAGDILTSRITQSFKKYVFNACTSTPIVLAKLENDAGMYGSVKSLF